MRESYTVALRRFRASDRIRVTESASSWCVCRRSSWRSSNMGWGVCRVQRVGRRHPPRYVPNALGTFRGNAFNYAPRRNAASGIGLIQNASPVGAIVTHRLERTQHDPPTRSRGGCSTKGLSPWGNANLRHHSRLHLQEVRR